MEKVIFQPLHSNPGWMKQFTNAPSIEMYCLKYVVQSFIDLSFGKNKCGVHDGWYIQKLISDSAFAEMMTDTETKVWNSFVTVQNYIGNKKQ